MSEFLAAKGYEVVGTRRGNEAPEQEPPDARVVFGDVADAHCIQTLIEREQPDEIYNLAAITHVGDSFSAVSASFSINAMGAMNCLAAAAKIGAKFYQASTSELFGDSPPPQNEDSPMRPRSPYACAKLGAYWATRNYRERGLYAVNGILFNHESVRRGAGFVTQKVARAATAIARGEQDWLELGNLYARRDWGHAKDYVRGMWQLMQVPNPGDYVMATGEMRSVAELCETAFARVGIDDWRPYVKVNPDLYRPLEVERLCGDASKARAVGWKPEITFRQMINEMVDAAAVR